MIILEPTFLFNEDWALSVATKILAEIYRWAVGDGPFGSIWVLSRLNILSSPYQSNVRFEKLTPMQFSASDLAVGQYPVPVVNNPGVPLPIAHSHL